MERLSSLLERVNSRTGATLAVLWSLQFPRVRAYLARVLLAGGAAGLVLLNFGLDMEGRARRRQLVPGVSRLLVCCVLLSLWRSRLKARLFLMGCACRLLPPCHHVAVSSLYALLCRLRGSPFSLLPAGGGPRRFDDTCSICLEEPSDYAADCGHSFHRNCLERWVKRSAHCPVCKREVAAREDVLADLLLFSESKWSRHHAAFGSLYWTRPLL